MFTNKNSSKKNKYFMNLAMMQAHNALGNTGKNPAVGCVVVKNNCVISSGYTGLNGRPHAEHNALHLKTNLIQDSNIYITLEPCSHHGRTSPCVNKIIKKRIKKVFFSIKDPDLRSFNKSSKTFKKKNIKTNIGLLNNEIKKFYISYFKQKESKLPFVTGKIALSKDYFSVNKKSKWITNPYSRKRVQFMRSKYDCILTSIRTVVKDNPTLNCRIAGLENRSPVRILLDKKLEIAFNSKILKSSNIINTIIFYNKYKKKKIDYLKKMKIKSVLLPLNSNNNFNIREVLIKIKKLGYSRIFLECGLNLMTNFLRENLIDDFYIFTSDQKLNKKGAKSFKNIIRKISFDKAFKLVNVNLCGDRLFYCRMK